MKSKLETALEELESTAKLMIKKPLKDMAIESVRESMMQNRNRLQAITHEFMSNSMALDRAYMNFAAAADVLSGVLSNKKAFLKVNQHAMEQFEIESGFTAFEEVIKCLSSYGTEVSFEKPKCFVGDWIFEIAENGLLTLVESLPDSSD